jgi:SAM-dependent methyltransferase
MNSRTNSTCRACASPEATEWLYPQEMMFGMREKFAYFRCAGCGCLQLDETPANLDKYYPGDYYSYQTLHDIPISWIAKLKRHWAYPSMIRHKAGWNSVAGRWLCRFKKGPNIPHWLRLLARPVPSNGTILDVGCGSGATLLALRECGFSRLRGVDPFIPQPIAYAGGVCVDKQLLENIQGQFDLIIFNHVFEHLDNPIATLDQAARLLAEDGQILIRIPLADSAVAQKYRENWVQLDAPRHIMLHTRKSMDLLARKTGLKIIRVAYDSTDFQFWGSEQYLLGIPLFDPRSHHSHPVNSPFSPDKIEMFNAEAERLNAREQGDQAAFILAKE